MNDNIKQNVLKLQNAKATPQDIETYVKSAVSEGQQSPSVNPLQQAGQSALNFLGRTAQNIARGPLTMATRPGQLVGVGVGGLISKLTGNPQYYNNSIDALNKNNSLLGIPVKPINQETPESIGGEAATTISLGGVPGASAPVAGAISGALGGAGSAMQDNGSAMNVAGNAALGAGLGYVGGKVAQGISNKIAGAPTLDTALTKAGAVASPAESSAIQGTLTDNGITSLADKEDVTFAKNVLSNALHDAQTSVHNAPVDVISGEASPEAAYWGGKVSNLQNALRAVTQVGHFNSSGLISRLGPGGIGIGVGLGTLGSNTIQNAGNFLYNKFIAPAGVNPLSGSLSQ